MIEEAESSVPVTYCSKTHTMQQLAVADGDGPRRGQVYYKLLGARSNNLFISGISLFNIFWSNFVDTRCTRAVKFSPKNLMGGQTAFYSR